jgi:signal transduction histidine kinase
MSRRIAIAILLTVWATLIAGGLGAYFAVRAVMLADMDRQLEDFCRMLPDVEKLAGKATSRQARYIIYDLAGNRLSSSVVDAVRGADLEPVRRQFVRLDGGGGRYRSLTFRLHLDDGRRLTVLYSESAERFDAALTRLAWGLTIAGIAAGALAAGVAVIASRAALRPLRETAGVIGAIDEANLDRRIDGEKLPDELRPTAGKLNEMLDRLQNAFQRRKQFLADASHELRTPVASIVTSMEVALRRPRDAAELTATIEACLADAKLLRRMVQALLEHARGEATPPADETFRLRPLLDECAALVAPLAAEKGLTLVPSYANGEADDAELTTDRRRLASAVTNLLSNAVEYNRPGGTIEISIAWPVREAQGRPGGDDQVELAVRDTGVGIAPEHQAQIFEPFFRAGRGGAGDATAADHLGLGLFLVRSHAKAMGGFVRIESQPGVGTTFFVRLPRARRVMREAGRSSDVGTVRDAERKSAAAV